MFYLNVVISVSVISGVVVIVIGSTQHGGLFDTLCSMVKLLRSGEWEIYREVFIGAMLLVEGM